MGKTSHHTSYSVFMRDLQNFDKNQLIAVVRKIKKKFPNAKLDTNTDKTKLLKQLNGFLSHIHNYHRSFSRHENTDIDLDDEDEFVFVHESDIDSDYDRDDWVKIDAQDCDRAKRRLIDRNNRRKN